ncbi:TNF receptor-associated factor 3-like [Mizuhopecten yessoensis]|uniref:TNF receptor-associated factor 3 n=1 Tax=Mizuhopecten yessoensis TaxID=6573 RepID=A0A210PQD7_MIZYE|nr:TNF receptor-associated factor 3-like [Mizuhopecten yessoensis]XP_021377898.1 TNF receptor-associated factor 3-like [Mizuhopecten yessoensis]XP_021377899.1 TNF receptor-associated factor 3-like [Mizuhopecten yessoensis]OWF38674.1 TNF receptor-associated factor 3 [Mizuhopecten yessoensis]
MSHQSKNQYPELPTQFLCGQCNGILIRPLQLGCGHLVCEKCLDDLFGDSAKTVCQINGCGKHIHKNERSNHITEEKYREDDEEEAFDGTSIREDFKRLSEIQKKILERVGDLKEQNKEVEDHIKDARAVKRVQNKIRVTDVRLYELDDKVQHLWSRNYDGLLIWKIRDYARRCQEVGHCINSPPFYSSTYGYKMCGRIYLNGDGMGHGTHLSFYIVIMKGEYDALLPWPFQQDVTLMLMDQDTRTQNLSDTFKPDPENTSFGKPETDMNIASGVPQFVEHSVLESPTYLQDDTIYLKIKVDVDNIPDLAVTSDQGQVHDVEGVEEEGH